MQRILGVIFGASSVETLNLLWHTHWLLGIVGAIIALLSSKGLAKQAGRAMG